MLDKLKLDSKQQQVINAFNSGANLFVTGPAGTGKSLIIDYISKAPGKEILRLAPTGLAARNIKASTIHRVYGFPSTVLTIDNIGIKSEKQRAMLKTLDCMIVDEISMVSSNLFWGMDYLLRQANGNDLPFGGKQIICFGDVFQLPPVVSDDMIKRYLEDRYGGVYAFNPAAWCDAAFVPIVLDNIYRQQDCEFIKMLNAIRVCSPESGRYIKQLNQRVKTQKEVTAEMFNNPRHVSLCTTNMLAKAINDRALSALQDGGGIYCAELSGKVDKNDLPVDERLHIKKNAKVMLLANVNHGTAYGYCNGDMGIVEDYSNESVQVCLNDGRRVIVEPYTWISYEYELTTDNSGKLHLDPQPCGYVKQLPLRAGYACSIHKSQGLTLEAAHIGLGSGCFAHGQLYTALSRLKSIDGLTLDRPINLHEAFIDPQIQEFYQQLELEQSKH